MGVISAVAEFERDLLIERTQAGLRRAKAEGKTFGRPSALSEAQRSTVIDQLNAGASVAQIAREMKTSRQTIMRIRESASTPPGLTGVGRDGVPVALIDWDRRKSRGA